MMAQAAHLSVLDYTALLEERLKEKLAGVMPTVDRGEAIESGT